MKIFTKQYKSILIIISIIILIPILLMYGPINTFRVYWISTAMHTKNFKFLATTFFTGDYVKSVITSNALKTENKTDPTLINIKNGNGYTYSPVTGKYYKGYIIKVENPGRINFAISKNENGELLEKIVSDNNAKAGINAGGYVSDKARGIACGFSVYNSKILSYCSEGEKHTICGMNSENILVVGRFTNEEIESYKLKWAIEFGPILIVNNEKVSSTKFSGGFAPRTAIGQTKNGEILLLVVDGRQKTSIGATFSDLQEILYANGAVNAIALDGGSSSTMVIDNKLVNSPSDGDSERLLPNAILFN